LKPFVVLYDDDDNVAGGAARDALAATDVREVAERVAFALAQVAPVETVRTGRGDPAEIAVELHRIGPRCVFNLAEAARGVAALEACVAGLLDLMGLPYTGNPPQTLSLCLDKPRTKLVLAGAGIPVPRGVVVRDAARDALDGLRYPVIVKPAAMDASHGIDETSVVADERAARERASACLRSFPPAALVEEYVDGDDALVAILQESASAAPTVLPLGRIDFRLLAGAPRISSFASKWETDSAAYAETPAVYPADFPPQLAERIRRVAADAFAATGCRDYARVDVRVGRDGEVVVLEVNPNPSLSPDVGIARAAGLAGWSYDDLVRRLARNAEERGPLSALPPPR
jgi:D-alanine-D-alanine ligase